MNNPLTRHDPGKLPEPPEHLPETAAVWWWKLAAWCKVRNQFIKMDLMKLEDVSMLFARMEQLEAARDREIALMNINIQLAEAGFCVVDLEHLEIPEHKIFSEHKRTVNERSKKQTASPE